VAAPFAELNERGNRVNVHFQYEEGLKNRIKSIPGAKFVPVERGGPAWSLPKDLISMRQLREACGPGLRIGDGLKVWGRAEVARERNLHQIASLDDYPVEEMKLYKKLPDLATWLRPYQRADVMFLAETSAMNLNEQRLGKTPEIVAAIYEADLEDGAHLIVSPQKALESVWRMEFERWTDLLVFTWSGESTGPERARTLGRLWKCLDDGTPFVFATTADMVRRGLPDEIEMNVKWASFVIDEYHRTGLAETKNVFTKKAANIHGERKWPMSGTPMGGKPIKLFSPLNLLHPDKFTSKWNWAGQWLEVETTYGNHKKIGGIQKGKEDLFYASLAPYVVRRLRSEVLPQLPPKQYVDVPCPMTRRQAAQYRTFAAQAEIRIDEYHLSATSILAEYTRLKQFANARCEVEVLSDPDPETGKVDMKLKPTFDSGKLPMLMDKLADAGIVPGDFEGESQAIVASQFRETVDMVHNYLTQHGIPSIRITGKARKKETEQAQRAFKHENPSEGLRVCCMVTTLGIGLTLNNVSDIHILDETWVPDDQDQLSDRAIDTTRLHQVNVLVYRSDDTIEQYIQDVNYDKRSLNKEILDLRRQGFRAAVVSKGKAR
jgi:SNF2 family DNA or RNA helicase